MAILPHSWHIRITYFKYLIFLNMNLFQLHEPLYKLKITISFFTSTMSNTIIIFCPCSTFRWLFCLIFCIGSHVNVLSFWSLETIQPDDYCSLTNTAAWRPLQSDACLTTPSDAANEDTGKGMILYEISKYPEAWHRMLIRIYYCIAHWICW